VIFLPPSHINEKLAQTDWPILPTHAIHLATSALCELVSVSLQRVQLCTVKLPTVNKLRYEAGTWYDGAELAQRFALELNDFLKLVAKVEVRMSKEEGNIDIGLNLIDLKVGLIFYIIFIEMKFVNY